jgi:hypothetical protein
MEIDRDLEIDHGVETDGVAQLAAKLDVDQKLALVGRIWESIDFEEIPVCGWHVGFPEGVVDRPPIERLSERAACQAAPARVQD